ncbi:MAG: hypothetical protein P8184_17075 [Calditrichia bacterium]
MNLYQKIKVSGAFLQAWLRGWRTRHKIVVIESDDWGTIRTSSRRAYDDLLRRGFRMNQSPLGADSLESSQDLIQLFAVLAEVDQFGHPACLTANMILTNPDFSRIRENGYGRYYAEPVTDTFQRTPERREVAALWKQGLDQKLFVPQLHGLEHIRWWDWLAALQAGSQEAHLAFEWQMCGLPGTVSREKRNFYGKYYLKNATGAPSLPEIAVSIRESISLFERIFGFTPDTTIAPGYCWYDEIEKIWKDNGIRYIQSDIRQFMGDEKRTALHFPGEVGASGPIYLIRNCQFEPAACRIAGKKSCLERCLRQISLAFSFRKPAVISSHRYNYMGSVFPENREKNLEQLRKLLTAIQSRWPDVVFLNSSGLGHLIEFGDDKIEQAMAKPETRGYSPETNPPSKRNFTFKN